MSIHLHHGYRASTTTYPTHETLLAAIAPVADQTRDNLDTSLYARLVTELYDDQHTASTTQNTEEETNSLILNNQPNTVTTSTPVSLLTQARDQFLENVNQTTPGYVWNNPHSLDIDISSIPYDGYWYLLIHNQNNDYHISLTNILPGLDHHPYYNHVDHPTNVTTIEWAQRRNDWAFLLNAPDIKTVTTRWTHRNTATPNWALLTPETVITNQPTIWYRAHRLAQLEAVTTYLTSNPTNNTHQLMKILNHPTVTERAHTIKTTLHPLTLNDLT